MFSTEFKILRRIFLENLLQNLTLSLCKIWFVYYEECRAPTCWMDLCIYRNSRYYCILRLCACSVASRGSMLWNYVQYAIWWLVMLYCTILCLICIPLYVLFMIVMNCGYFAVLYKYWSYWISRYMIYYRYVLRSIWYVGE